MFDAYNLKIFEYDVPRYSGKKLTLESIILYGNSSLYIYAFE